MSVDVEQSGTEACCSLVPPFSMQAHLQEGLMGDLRVREQEHNPLALQPGLLIQVLLHDSMHQRCSISAELSYVRWI